MIPQLRSELLKQRTTRTNLGLFASMIAIIAAVVLLHMVSLPSQALSGREGQLKVLGLGTTFGMIFAALLGALSVTNEIRHGSIRATFLATPKRSRVIAAKAAASLIGGAGFGFVAEAIAIGVGSSGLSARGISIAPSTGDFAQLLLGGAAAAALLATIGVSIGAIVRNQVGAAVGLVVWLLFAEMTLIGSVPSVGKFLPGASAAAIAGAMLEQTASYLLAPALGTLFIAAYSAAALGAGLIATARRDVS
jgi:ABC-type transport system involved in multi-copper enzyme maturation permease subunit